MKRVVRVISLMAALIFSITGICFAQGGKVTYLDGRPAVGAEVHVHLLESDKFKTLTDAAGKFVLPHLDIFDALVQIKAPEGQDYATVSLPVQVFENSEVAIVLQPQK